MFLSEPSTEYRLGNLLADLVRGADRDQMPTDFLRGAAAHKVIDAFTDAHPIVHRSRARVAARYRRFSGVLVDIFYDYLLAQRWSDYSAQPLDAFTAEFYAGVGGNSLRLPAEAEATLERIVRHDLLGQYRHIKGVENSLRRVSTYIAQRWKRDYSLETSVADLQAHEQGFASDFAAFFPELQAHVAARRV